MATHSSANPISMHFDEKAFRATTRKASRLPGSQVEAIVPSPVAPHGDRRHRNIAEDVLIPR